MSSISASDRGSSQDELKRMREEYDKNEAETAKKKAREVHSLNEKYEKDLGEVRKQYDDQVGVIREKNHEILDDRDRRHAEDVAKIRDMYMESLKRKTTDEDRERTATKSAYESEINKEKVISQGQREEAERNFTSSMRERDRVAQDFNGRAITEMQDGLRERVDKLNEKHQSELESLTEDRERGIDDLQRTIANLKMSDRDRALADDRSHRGEMDRRTSAFETMYRNQEKNNAYQMQTLGKSLKEEKAHLRSVNDERLADANEKSEALREQFANEIQSRTGSVLSRAKADMSEARNEQILDAITNRRLRDIDHNHLQRAYQEREEDLNHQREEASQRANEMAEKKIGKVVDRSDKLIATTNWKNRMNEDIENMRNREALSNLETMSKDRLDEANNRADSRIHKIMKNTNLAEEQETRQHEQNVDALRKTYGDNLQNQREANLDSMKSIYQRMDGRVRELEANWMKKHADTVDFYENKISDLENQRKTDLQRMSQTYEARNTQREKAVKMEEDSLTEKYEQKLAIQEEGHRKEMDRLERRHQEQMQAVISRGSAPNERKA